MNVLSRYTVAVMLVSIFLVYTNCGPSSSGTFIDETLQSSTSPEDTPVTPPVPAPTPDPDPTPAPVPDPDPIPPVVTPAEPTTPTPSTPTPPPTPPPFSPVLVKALNIGGPAVTINGILYDSDTNSNTVIGGASFGMRATPLVDNPGIMKPILETFAWNSSGQMTVETPVPNGNYSVYIHTHEDDTTMNFHLMVEGQFDPTNFSTGAVRTAKKMGPFAATIVDGKLSLLVTGGHLNLNGVEIYTSASPAATIAQPWTQCAAEYEDCSFTGTKIVRFGPPSGPYIYKEHTNQVACDYRVLGDPAPGAGKVCSYLNIP